MFRGFIGFTCLLILQKIQVLQEVQIKNILCFITTIKQITGFTDFTCLQVLKNYRFYKRNSLKIFYILLQLFKNYRF